MNHLVKAMLDKNALNSDTVITAWYQAKGAFGHIIKKQDDFIMTDVQKQGEEYKLTLRQIIGKSTVTIWARDIIAIDGMQPERYVDVYDINPDGSRKKTGKKRGRKPKSICEVIKTIS